MAYNDSINVRLGGDMKQRLEVLAREFGVKPSDLIRQAVEEGIRKLEKAEVIEIRRKPLDESSRLNEPAPQPPKKTKKA